MVMAIGMYFIFISIQFILILFNAHTAFAITHLYISWRISAHKWTQSHRDSGRERADQIFDFIILNCLLGIHKTKQNKKSTILFIFIMRCAAIRTTVAVIWMRYFRSKIFLCNIWLNIALVFSSSHYTISTYYVSYKCVFVFF